MSYVSIKRWTGKLTEDSKVYVLYRTYGGMADTSYRYQNLLFLYWVNKHDPDGFSSKTRFIALRDNFYATQESATTELQALFDQDIILILTDLGVIFENQKKTWNYLKRINEHFLCIYVLQLSFDLHVSQLKWKYTFFNEHSSPGRRNNARKISIDQYDEMIEYLLTKKEDGSYPTLKECQHYFKLPSLGSLYHYLKSSDKYDANTLGELIKLRD